MDVWCCAVVYSDTWAGTRMSNLLHITCESEATSDRRLLSALARLHDRRRCADQVLAVRHPNGRAGAQHARQQGTRITWDSLIQGAVRATANDGSQHLVWAVSLIERVPEAYALIAAPEDLRIVDDFPRTASGKIRKVDLRTRLRSEAERAQGSDR